MRGILTHEIRKRKTQTIAGGNDADFSGHVFASTLALPGTQHMP